MLEARSNYPADAVRVRHARPGVAHCASPFLELTTVWIYDQMRMLSRYEPIGVTQAVRNLESFPVGRLVDASGVGLSRVWRRISRKATGTYAGYAELLREAGAVLVHAHFGQEGFRCLRGKRDAGLPMVTTFYGLDVSVLPRIKSWRVRYGQLFAEGEMFLAEGPHMAQCLVDLGCPADKVSVQKIGVDLAAIPFELPSARADSRTVLMYASLREKKGHLYGFRAFARIAEAHPDVHLDVIGDGPLRGSLEAEADRLGISDRISFLGMRPHPECLARLGKARALLYPSVTAEDGDTEGGAPVGLIEAMAAGLPVISTRHADIGNVVPDGECGLLSGERDVDGLVEGLDAVLGSATFSDRLAKAGRAHVEMEHDLGRQVGRLEERYDDLLGSNRN